MVLHNICLDPTASSGHRRVTEYSKTQNGFAQYLSWSNGVFMTPPGDRILLSTIVSHNLCLDPMASSGHRRATEYCKTQWFRTIFVLTQWLPQDTAGWQNTVKHIGFAQLLSWSNGFFGTPPGDKILQNTMVSHSFCLDPMASSGYFGAQCATAFFLQCANQAGCYLYLLFVPNSICM